MHMAVKLDITPLVKLYSMNPVWMENLKEQYVKVISQTMSAVELWSSKLIQAVQPSVKLKPLKYWQNLNEGERYK